MNQHFNIIQFTPEEVDALNTAIGILKLHGDHPNDSACDALAGADDAISKCLTMTEGES